MRDLGVEWQKGPRKRASASANCWARRVAAIVRIRKLTAKAGWEAQPRVWKAAEEAQE